MAIDGRINIDVLFHDTDGTTSLKVVSLDSSHEQSAGKVAFLTGTVSTTQVTVANLASATTYRNAAGNLVSFEYLRAVAFAYTGSGANGNATLTIREDGTDFLYMSSREGRVSVSQGRPYYLPEILLNADGIGTGTYTIVLYGT